MAKQNHTEHHADHFSCHSSCDEDERVKTLENDKHENLTQCAQQAKLDNMHNYLRIMLSKVVCVCNFAVEPKEGRESKRIYKDEGVQDTH